MNLRPLGYEHPNGRLSPLPQSPSLQLFSEHIAVGASPIPRRSSRLAASWSRVWSRVSMPQHLAQARPPAVLPFHTSGYAPGWSPFGSADIRALRVAPGLAGTSRWTPSSGAANDDHVDRTYPGSDGEPRAVPGVQPSTGEEPHSVPGAVARGEELWLRRGAVETAWQIGGIGEVAWIAENTRPGTTIATAIPPIFGAYATVNVPGTHQEKPISDDALLSVLRAHSSPQP